MSATAPLEIVQERIIVLRGRRVLIDRDLAALYRVSTKRLNEQVRRNRRRFPDDFVFQLTREEAGAMAASRSQIATLKRGGNIKHLPWAFTEHGAIQAATVLSSTAATEMSVTIVRAFVRLRQFMVRHRALAAKLAELDARVGAHDKQLALIVDAIRQLALPASPERDRKIGFHRGNR
jgi:ORF6N domain